MFTFGTRNYFQDELQGISFVTFIILSIIFVIDLLCMLISKLNKSEELFSKAKLLAEKTFYYAWLVFIFTLAIDRVRNLGLGYFIWQFLIFSMLILSLFFRKKDKKKISYIFLLIMSFMSVSLFVLYNFVPEVSY